MEMGLCMTKKRGLVIGGAALLTLLAVIFVPVGRDKRVTEKELHTLKKVNPFDYIDISFFGISPAGSVRLQKKQSGEDVMQTVTLRADKLLAENAAEVQTGNDVTVQGLKLGDIVKVSVMTNENNEQIRQKYGTELTELSREFVVKDIAEYVSDVAEIEGHTMFDNLKTKTENVLKAYFEKEKKTIAQSGLRYEGYYFLGCKNAEKVNGNPVKYNKLYVIYSTTVKTKDKKYNNFTPTKVYFPVCYRNFVKGTDGNITANLNEYERAGGVTLGYRFIQGFTDLTSMKHALLVADAVGYHGTCGGNLETP